MKQLNPQPGKERRRDRPQRLKHAVRKAHDRMFNFLRSPARAQFCPRK